MVPVVGANLEAGVSHSIPAVEYLGYFVGSISQGEAQGSFIGPVSGVAVDLYGRGNSSGGHRNALREEGYPSNSRRMEAATLEMFETGSIKMSLPSRICTAARAESPRSSAASGPTTAVRVAGCFRRTRPIV